jgi:hypothetical protein
VREQRVTPPLNHNVYPWRELRGAAIAAWPRSPSVVARPRIHTTLGDEDQYTRKPLDAQPRNIEIQTWLTFGE